MRKLIKTLLLASAFLSTAAFADPVDPFNIGLITYHINIPGSTASFDISNQTGPNSSVFPDMTFPVTTSVNLTSLGLTVHFSDGSVVTEPSTYFTRLIRGRILCSGRSRKRSGTPED